MNREEVLDKGWGRSIAAHREKRGLTQDQLATALVIRSEGYPWTQTTVSRIELAKRPIRLVEAIDMAGVFGITVEQLLGGATETKVPDTHQREMELHWLHDVINDRLAALAGQRPPVRRRRFEAARKMAAKV